MMVLGFPNLAHEAGLLVTILSIASNQSFIMYLKIKPGVYILNFD